MKTLGRSAEWNLLFPESIGFSAGACGWSDKSLYHMTRTAPRALSLQNYCENPRMRAVRDGTSRAGISRPALLGSRTAVCEKRTNLSAKTSDVSELSDSEFYFPKKKKKKRKVQWSYDKLLID